MSLGNKIAKNITANYVGVAGQVVIAFFLAPFLVHTLGDTRYGIWTIVAAFSGYMSLLDLGIAGAITRYVALYYQRNDHKSINTIISSGAFLFYAVAGLIIVLSPLSAKVLVSFLSFDKELIDTVYFLVIVISFDISFFVIAGFVRGALGGFQRFDLINLVRLLSFIYKALAFYIFLNNGYGLLAMGFISVSTNLLVLIISFYQLKKYFPFIQIGIGQVNRQDLSKVYHFSKFIFLAMVANQILYYSDAFIVGYFLSMAAVTYYTIPWSLSDYVKQFCIAISGTYIPVFSELHSANDTSAIYDHYIYGTKIILILSNLFCVGLIVLGAPFITLWMGALYADKAETLIIIFFITLYFYAPHLISYSLLQALNRHKLYSYLSAMIAVINLILSIILVQKYGLIGVAIGAAIPQILFFGILVPFYTGKIYGWSYLSYIYQTHIKLVFPTALLFAGLEMMKSYFYPDSYLILILESITVSILYFFSVYIFSLSSDERWHVRALLNKVRPGAAS